MNILITGLITGSMLALLAIGFSLIFGVARIVNIAHTAFYMVAAYCIYYLSIRLGLNAILSMLIAVVGVTLVGLLVYKLVIDPIREHEAAVLIATIALAMFFQEVILQLFTGDYRSVDFMVQGFFTIGGNKIFYQQLLTFGVVLVILLVVWFLLMKTRLGLAIRSTAEDREVANLMGMNESRLAMITLGYLGRPGWGHRCGDWAPYGPNSSYVDGTPDYHDGRCGTGRAGQYQGKFYRCFYFGVYRGPGGFSGPHRGLFKGPCGLVDHDPGSVDTAGGPVWYRF